MTKELDEKFVSDDGYSYAADAVDGAGGKIKPKRADVKKSVDPVADDVAAAPGNKSSKGAIDGDGAARKTVVVKSVALPEGEETDADEIVEEVLEIDEAVAALFEGENLSEEFTTKAKLIFTAAINEEVTRRLEEATASLAEEAEEAIAEAVQENLEDIIESLDGYLNYVVGEWMEENEVALEAGIKVEMAESLMASLVETFYNHNIQIDEDTLDVVAALEEELEEVRGEANASITENIELKNKLHALAAGQVFAEATEGLSVTQAERLRILAEKISNDDLDTYASDLETLKESFLTDRKARTLVESVADEDESDEVITEETDTAPARRLHEDVAPYVGVFDRVVASRKK